MNATETHRTAMAAGAFSNDLVPETLRTENSIQQHLQKMTRSWITMQINAAGFFQHTVQLNEARRHHREVRHHR